MYLYIGTIIIEIITSVCIDLYSIRQLWDMTYCTPTTVNPTLGYLALLDNMNI